MLNRRFTQRLQRAEVVAHRRDVGVSSIRERAESHAILAALSEQIQRSVQEPRLRPQAGLATLVCFHRRHRKDSIRCLKYLQASVTRTLDRWPRRNPARS